MSLNRREQQLCDYIEANPEERRFWEHKVRQIGAKQASPAEAARLIESELGRYLVERAGVVASLRDGAAGAGMCRVSLRNLAEHLLRLWSPPRPAAKPPAH